MKKIKIEENVGQNWETYLIYYDTGLGAIENIKEKHIDRVYVNKETIKDLWQFYTTNKNVKIKPANWITNLLIKLKIFKFDIIYDVENK